MRDTEMVVILLQDIEVAVVAEVEESVKFADESPKPVRNPRSPFDIFHKAVVSVICGFRSR